MALSRADVSGDRLVGLAIGEYLSQTMLTKLCVLHVICDVLHTDCVDLICGAPKLVDHQLYWNTNIEIPV